MSLDTFTKPPSAIGVLSSGVAVVTRAMELAAAQRLTARRVHDAHPAAIALVNGVTGVYTYDVEDWQGFQAHGLHVRRTPVRARIAAESAGALLTSRSSTGSCRRRPY